MLALKLTRTDMLFWIAIENGHVPGQLNQGINLRCHNDLRLAVLVQRIASLERSYGDRSIRLGHHLENLGHVVLVGGGGMVETFGSSLRA